MIFAPAGGNFEAAKVDRIWRGFAVRAVIQCCNARSLYWCDLVNWMAGLNHRSRGREPPGCAVRGVASAAMIKRSALLILERPHIMLGAGGAEARSARPSYCCKAASEAGSGTSVPRPTPPSGCEGIGSRAVVPSASEIEVLGVHNSVTVGNRPLCSRCLCANCSSAPAC